MVAGLDVYGAAIAPWLGIAIAVFVVCTAWRLRGVRSSALTWRRIAIPIAGAVILVAIALPVISGASTFVHTVNAVLGQSDELGNLVAPLQTWEILGIWPNGDFRFPSLNYSFAYVLIGVALIGSVLGALWMLRRRTLRPAAAAGRRRGRRGVPAEPHLAVRGGEGDDDLLGRRRC